MRINFKIDNAIAIIRRKQFIEYLQTLVESMDKLNSIGITRDSILKKFIRDISKNYNCRMKEEQMNQEFKFVEDKTKLIKLILQLEIKDLEIVKKIYNLAGYAIDIESPKEPYDASLILFIKEDLYDGFLENTFRNNTYEEINEILKRYFEINTINKLNYQENYKKNNISLYEKNKEIQSNLEKFKIVFIMYVREMNEEYTDSYKLFVKEIFEEMFFINPEYEDYLYTDSKYYDNFEILFSEKYFSTKSASIKTISIRQFINAILLMFLFKIFTSPKINIKGLIRKRFEKSNLTYEELVLLDMINYDNKFGEGFFKNAYKVIFLDEGENTFVEYFTELLCKLQNKAKDYNDKYSEFKKLDKKEIMEMVLNYKKEYDMLFYN